ncbi:transcription factor S-II (macronuclear) [Tetrahymena thermophila SB210]|uniref:Transcription factor S-II n=1 Tax=Tetrahymena thermophila (strain SB210) TaxID=312017 RepID=I7LT54_TETTS|nr:transcription factor S-II [Tetrahymena thermophila SB210]EAR84422.3 transcription factor S-II [Tetrahymena thermophila SB210]|eukprot:XP_001032085.3 transcription factor S-II [Tetrahymena thermophila SB210]
MDQLYTEDELTEFKNDLRKFKEIGNTKVLAIVKRLFNCQITVQQLQNTKIAQTVQSLSTMSCFDEDEEGQEAKQICSQIINKWKKIVQNEKNKQNPQASSQKAPQLTKSNSQTATLPRRQSSGQGSTETFLTNEEPQYKTESKTDLPTYKSDIRQKGLEAINKIFMKVKDDINASPREWIELIVNLEKKIFSRNSQVVYYKSYIKEVLGMFSSNEVTTEVISKMLNKEISLQDVAEAKTSVFLTDRQRAQQKKAVEDQLATSDPDFYNNMRRQRLQGLEGELCKGCKKKTAFLVKELQTRSSDEPMTRFMECNSCGKSWKD